jgi:serine/threonine protein kinase
VQLDYRVGPPGRRNHYRLVHQLGRGGEGEVWEAEEAIAPHRWVTVAIKIQPLETPVADDHYGALLRNLPSIPGLVDVLEEFIGPAPGRPPRADTDPAPAQPTEGRPPHGQPPPGSSPRGWPVHEEPPADQRAYRYVVMRYVSGESLEARLGSLPLPARLEALAPVATALDTLHAGIDIGEPGRVVRSAITHGDVKPANVVLDENDAGTLVDLGSAAITGDGRITGRTRLYAAPELLRGGGVPGPRTDRYSFAATVAHAVLGKRPPGGPDGLDVAALAEEFARRRVDAKLAVAVRKALTALPDERPWPLTDWLAGLIRLTQPPKRKARHLALAGGIATVLVATAGLLLVETGPTDPHAAKPSPTVAGAPSGTGAATPTTPTAPTAPGNPPSTATTSKPPSKGPTASRSGGGPKASMGCAPSSCTTTKRTIQVSGTFTGTIAGGHRLKLFNHAPDGRYYAGSDGQATGGRWTGEVYVGNDKPDGQPSFRYDTCLYDIDAAFSEDLDRRGNDALNDGLTTFPTTGTATSLACRTVVWNRP